MSIPSKLRSKKFLVIAGGAVVLFLFAGMEFTMTPTFCRTCHIMKPYYKEWKHSAHKEIACVECHIEPGVNNLLKRKVAAAHEVVSMVTGKAPLRPHTSVRDVVCLRPGCHTIDSINKKDDLRLDHSVKFRHESHVGNELSIGKLMCTSCHTQMVDNEHFGVHPEACVICHYRMNDDVASRTDSDFCLTCHKVPDKELKVYGADMTFVHTDHQGSGLACKNCHMEMTAGEAPVQRHLCRYCHKDETIAEKATDLLKVHESHVKERKVECTMCHAPINHEPRPGHWNGNQEQCGQCHAPSHIATSRLWSGTGGKGIGDMPSVKTRLGIDCVACHQQGSAHKLTGSPDAAEGCVSCHGDDGKEYLASWKADLEKAQTETAKMLAEATKRLGNGSARADLLSEARANLEFVKAARGVHNFEYSIALLEHSREQLRKALE